MSKWYIAKNVRCKVCGEGLLRSAPLVATKEEAEAWGEREFRRRMPDMPLALKARTCSATCYAALPPWRRLVLKCLPFLARRLFS